MLRRDIAIAITPDWFCFATKRRPDLKIPAVVGMRKDTRQVIAAGEGALNFSQSGNQGLVFRRAVEGGEWQFDVLVTLMKHGITRVTGGNTLFPPRIVVCGQFTREAHRRVILEACRESGARDTHLLPFTIATALGLDWKIDQPEHQRLLQLDRDGFTYGTISLSGLAAECAIPWGVDGMIEEIQIYMEGAESRVPSATELEDHLLKHGFAQDGNLLCWNSWIKTVHLGSETVEPVSKETILCGAIPTLYRLRKRYFQCHDGLTPEVRREIYRKPIHLIGRFATMPGLPGLLRTLLNAEIRVESAPQPETALRGTRVVLENLKFLQKTRE